MNDSEWLQSIKNKHPPPVAPKAAKKNPGILVFLALAVVVGLYFYFDTKHRQFAKINAQQTAKKATTAPRALTIAEIQDIDAKNRAYAKKLDDDYYRKEISTSILQLNNIAERFNDMNRVAAGTARIALPGVIQQMQGLRREAAAITPHQCLRLSAASMANAISETVDGYLSFMQARSDAATGLASQHFDNARAHLIQYIKQRDACVTW